MRSKALSPSCLTALIALLWACSSQATDPAAVDRVLDSFHQAASDADFERYSAQMTQDVVFLGTDATERWQGSEFRGFARGYFDKGQGWTYRPTQRGIDFAADGRTAWFDELLQHDRLGQCRGSGVLLQVDGRWLIAQYNLSVPIPNEMVDAVAAGIIAVADGATLAVEVDDSGAVQEVVIETEGAAVEAAATDEVVEEAPQKDPRRCRKHHKSNSRVKC